MVGSEGEKDAWAARDKRLGQRCRADQRNKARMIFNTSIVKAGRNHRELGGQEERWPMQAECSFLKGLSGSCLPEHSPQGVSTNFDFMKSFYNAFPLLCNRSQSLSSP
jgi:hypothetical protein